MAFTGTALRTAKLDLTLLGCESLITCSPLVRLGDKGQTIISARISNGDPALDLAGWVMGFEATVGDKLIRDENQSRFRLVGKNTVEYKCSDEVHSFIGTVNVAYFTLKKDGTTATTQNFTIHSLQNAETGTDGLKEHYISVIDDLVASNDSAMKKAEEIRDLINKNQVVRKSGDTMSGNLEFERTKGVRFKNGDGVSVMSLAADNLNRFVGFSDATNENVFVYDPATKFFDLRSGTNLLKKTGDTMTGNLRRERGVGEGAYEFYSGGALSSKLADDNNNIFLHDSATGKVAWQYSKTTSKFTVNVDTNLVKKSDIYIDWVTSTGTPKPVAAGVDINTITDSGVWQANGNPNLPNTGGQWFILEVFRHTGTYVVQRATRFANTIPETYVRSMNGGSWGSWQTILGGKDGRANLTLTADGIAWDGATPNVADRRGNTVTLRLAINRKVGSSGDVVATLPIDMRPTLNVIESFIANDGTPVRVTVESGGNVKVAVEGKNMYATITYVVD